MSILSSVDAVLYLRKDRDDPTRINVTADSQAWSYVRQLPTGAYRLEATTSEPAVAGAFVAAVSVDPPITSEGTDTHNSGEWNNLGVTGDGITVGVVDGGFRRYRDFVGVEVPEPKGELCYDFRGRVSCSLTTGDHGTAVAEAIVDIAPDADLFIVDAYTKGDLHAAVGSMLGAGATVVNMSLSYTWEGPPDGTSPNENSVSGAVDAATRGGIVWLNSAGNAAGHTWRGAYSDSDSDGLIEFGAGDETNQFRHYSYRCSIFEMRWDDAWGGATSDMDLYAIDSYGRILASSVDYQSGREGHYPYEALRLCAREGQYRMVARRESGAAPAWVEIREFGSSVSLEHTTPAGSIQYPADMENPAMLAVGATPWFDTSDVEDFSSRGPTSDNRIKPDIVGADKGASAAYSRQFSGTSQASPHVAGMAALVRQLNPHMSAREVARYLTDQAVPRPAEAGGAPEVPNSVWGYGLARLPGTREMRTETPRELKYPSAGVFDRFGWSAAISADGNTAAVGAKDADLAAVGGARSGAVYVFTKSAGAWSSGVKLVPSDGAAGDAFGWSVAISADGNTIVVGAQGDDAAGADGESAGAAYVFVKSAGAWSSGAKLTADDRAGYQGFGYSVSISGDGNTVVAGALGHTTNTGAAYVFTKPSGGWGTSPMSSSVKLTAADGASRDFFGVSVSTNSDGSAVAVGALGDGGSAGAAYVFTRPAGGWTSSSSSAKLTAADGSLADRFGASLSMSADGSTVAVGAYSDHYEKGSAYVFAKPAGGWGTSPIASSVKLAAADGELGEWFGRSTAVSSDGGVIAVGANRDDVRAGAVYVFAKPATGWATTSTAAAKLRGPAAEREGSIFGFGLAMKADGGAVLAGAPYGATGRGGAYVFDKPATGWADSSTSTKLSSPSPDTGDQVGASVAISADESAILTGAPGADPGGNESAGAAYMFGEPPRGWGSLTATSTPDILAASDGAAGGKLGTSVSISENGGVAMAGAPGRANGTGGVYIFVKPSDGWGNGAAIAETLRLAASDGAAGDKFGNSLSLNWNGGVAAVGAPGDDGGKGGVYLYRRNDPPGGGDDQTWTSTSASEERKLVASDGAAGDAFGTSVAIARDWSVVAVGAPGDDGGKGAVYVFAMPSEGWWGSAQPTSVKITTDDGAAGDRFGESVAFDESGSSFLIAGAPGDDGGKGAAYILHRPGAGWTEYPGMSKLTAYDGEAGDRFGESVAFDAFFIPWVAAPYDDFYADNAGSVYYYNSDTWDYANKLTRSHSAWGDNANSRFGSAIAVGWSATAVVGAPMLRQAELGAAYVYAYDGSNPVYDPPRARIPAPLVLIRESAGGMSLADFAVSLSDPSERTVTVEYATSDETADAGSDYVPASGTLIFAPGETKKTARIKVIGDSVRESDETFTVALKSPTNAKISGFASRARGRIIDRAAPWPAAAPTSLAFALDLDDTPSQTLTFDVWNISEGSLNFSVSTDADWLTVSPESDASAGATDRKTVSATANVANMHAGSHAATITASAPSAPDIEVSVSATVTRRRAAGGVKARSAVHSGYGRRGQGYAGALIRRMEQRRGQPNLHRIRRRRLANPISRIQHVRRRD